MKTYLKTLQDVIFNILTCKSCWHIIYFVIIRLESHRQELGHFKDSLKITNILHDP